MAIIVLVEELERLNDFALLVMSKLISHVDSAIYISRSGQFDTFLKIAHVLRQQPTHILSHLLPPLLPHELKKLTQIVLSYPTLTANLKRVDVSSKNNKSSSVLSSHSSPSS